MGHLIFDFDGTIVDSGHVVFKSLSESTCHTGLTWDELRDLPSHKVVSALGITKLDLPKLILKVRNDFKNQIKNQPLADGIAEALVELKEQGFKLYIVSSNSKENIEEFLKIHRLFDAFTTITSFFTIFGKAHGVEKLLGKLRIEPAKAIYIGDETRDIQAAEKVGIKSLAVCWGYNSAKVLASYNPVYLAKTPKDMVAILCKARA